MVFAPFVKFVIGSSVSSDAQKRSPVTKKVGMIEKRRKLNSQQMRFIDGIIQGKNRTDAYIDAGYKTRNRRNVNSAATRLYANLNVQQEIQRQEKAIRHYSSHHLASLT